LSIKIEQNRNRDFSLKIESKSIVWLKSHIVTALQQTITEADMLLAVHSSSMDHEQKSNYNGPQRTSICRPISTRRLDKG